MSAVTENIFGRTSAFAPPLLREPSNAATTQRADVFARRERYTAAVSLPEPKRIVVDLQIGDQSVQLTCSDFGSGLPSWVEPVLRSMEERWGRVPGWDSYDAKPTDLHHAIRLLEYLSELLRHNSTPPVITPLVDGGVQAEWHRNEQDLEIVVPSDDVARYYYYNAATGKEQEEELTPPRFSLVRTLIDHF